MKKYLLTALLILFFPLASMAQIANEARLDYNKGVDYYKIGQYEKAAKYFRSAINISPDFIDAYYNLGSILEYLKQYDSALSVFQQIIIRNPEDYESVYKAATIAYQLGKYDEALKYTTLIPRSANEYDLSNKLASKVQLILQLFQIVHICLKVFKVRQAWLLMILEIFMLHVTLTMLLQKYFQMADV